MNILPGIKNQAQKETLVHKLLDHRNIIKFIEFIEYNNHCFIIQEWASGGELFEQIEPDVGFPEMVAHFYFVQLIHSIVPYTFFPNFVFIILIELYSFNWCLSPRFKTRKSIDRRIWKFEIGRFRIVHNFQAW